MGPFPHDAPQSKITLKNPAGTDVFVVVEFTDKKPDMLRGSFSCMGFAMTARHRSKAIDLWQQDDITFGLNAEPDGFVARFGAQYGPCAPAMRWQLVSAQKAFDHVVSRGAEPYMKADRSFNMPAIKGIGGSLLYFVQYDGISDPFASEFKRASKDLLKGVGFYYPDDLPHNVSKGNMTDGPSFIKSCLTSVIFLN